MTWSVRHCDLAKAAMNNLTLHSHRSQLITTAAVASLTTLAVSSVYTSYIKRKKRRTLDREIHDSISALNEDRDEEPTPIDGYEELTRNSRTIKPQEQTTVLSGAVYDEELIREQLARNYTFFGEEGMEKIRGGKVVIVGCGGVGSWAAVMLVRSCVFCTNNHTPKLIWRMTIEAFQTSD